MTEEIRRQFISRYGKEPLVVTSPGRVNLIGEHLDYNDGFVLPGAIDKKIVVAIARNDQNMINVYAKEFDETLSFSTNDIKADSGWKNYILGVTFYVQEQTKKLSSGLDVMIDGDVPVGGGMSSSAALCCGYGFALNHLFDLGLSRLEIALIGQKTEHHFVGAKVGIMDQFASLHGKAGNLIRLDCRTMDYKYVPFNFPGYKIVMVNSMVKHSLAGSEYNVRRQQCEQGVKALQTIHPGIKALRDVNFDMLSELHLLVDNKVFDRCKYVVEEIDRLLRACEFLENGDIAKFGELMYQTHEGLSNLYEVSCEELDFLVSEARKEKSVVGSRMMGGGFGGCTINIVQVDAVDRFIDTIKKAFNQQFEIVPEIYLVSIEDGTKVC